MDFRSTNLELELKVKIVEKVLYVERNLGLKVGAIWRSFKNSFTGLKFKEDANGLKILKFR